MVRWRPLKWFVSVMLVLQRHWRLKRVLHRRCVLSSQTQTVITHIAFYRDFSVAARMGACIHDDVWHVGRGIRMRKIMIDQMLTGRRGWSQTMMAMTREVIQKCVFGGAGGRCRTIVVCKHMHMVSVVVAMVLVVAMVSARWRWWRVTMTTTMEQQGRSIRRCRVRIMECRDLIMIM